MTASRDISGRQRHESAETVLHRLCKLQRVRNPIDKKERNKWKLFDVSRLHCAMVALEMELGPGISLSSCLFPSVNDYQEQSSGTIATAVTAQHIYPTPEIESISFYTLIVNFPLTIPLIIELAIKTGLR